MKVRPGHLLEIPAALALLVLAIYVWATSALLGVGLLMGAFFFILGLFPKFLTGEDDERK